MCSRAAEPLSQSIYCSYFILYGFTVIQVAKLYLILAYLHIVTKLQKTRKREQCGHLEYMKK